IPATTAPTSIVSPSATRISVTTPAIGDGTSVSTLWVDTSNNGSSAATLSPTFLNHCVMVPSVTVSPSWGRVTSAMSGGFAPVSRSVVSSSVSAVEVAPGEGQHRLPEELGQARVRLDELGHLGHGRLPVHGAGAARELARQP